ncbi:metallophosphoesterase [Patescibacteria group bacterium]|nr:metallophosphoesterase [Patescibacteria group bacterium]
MDKENKNLIKYEFLDRSIFFPDKGVLVLGDIHIGYEQALIDAGVLIPNRQVKDIISDLKKIIKKIKDSKYNLKEIIFLGDIKHLFSYAWKEKDNLDKIVEFLEEYIPQEKIIFIRGNHDTTEIHSKIKLRDFYIHGEIAFLHGHKSFLEIFDKKIKVIITGHLHPSVILTEVPGVKIESYKCFLEGSYKNKTFIVLPSFIKFVEGTAINDYEEMYLESFSIIPKREIMNFKVYILGEERIYEFGKVKDFN